MSLERYKESIKSYKKLLESDTLGSFDFFTNTICLDSITIRDYDSFQRALATNEYHYLAKVIPLAVHEYTHFVDSTSTLWGLKHLLKMSNAYESNDAMGGREEGFYKAKEFLEHVRSLRLPKYYTVVDKHNIPQMPWKYSVTIGKQFGLNGRISEKPILFVNFANPDEDFLARSPISTVSLLEASAMSNELFAKLDLINTLPPGNKEVEMKIFERDNIKYLYNHTITEYSVCVHILANHLQCRNAIAAFAICSILVRITLNFSRSTLKRVAKKAKIHEILDIPKNHEFEKRMRDGLHHGNLGILYYLICRALPHDTHESKEKTITGIHAALIAINAPFELMQEESKKEASELISMLKKSRIAAINILASASNDNFKKIDFMTPGLPFKNISLPPVYLGDANEAVIFNNEENHFKNIGLSDIFDDLYSGQEWVERFSEACTA